MVPRARHLSCASTWRVEFFHSGYGEFINNSVGVSGIGVSILAVRGVMAFFAAGESSRIRKLLRSVVEAH